MFDRQTVIGIALNEVGYREKASNSKLDDKTANSGSANYTKYARDLDAIPGFYNGSKQGYPWCDVFVDWCFMKAYGIEEAKHLLCQPNNSAGAGCTYSMAYYREKGQFYQTPEVGDQIFFGSETESYHTGIVYAVSQTQVSTIEGNSGDGVNKRIYSRNYSEIIGYGRPEYLDGFAERKSEQTSSSIIQDISESYTQNIDGQIDTVKEVQIWLNQTFQSGLTIDGLFGSNTQTALIKALQIAVSVNVTGQYDDLTNYACSQLDLCIGSEGEAVKVLQAFLVCHGYKAAYVDGEFGFGTHNSLINYQRNSKISVDGIAAQDTFSTLCR